MNSPKILIATAFGAWLIGMLLFLPAQQVIGRLSLPPGIALIDLSGSLWSGRAGRLALDQPRLDIGPLDWDFAPLALLRGCIAFDLESTDPVLALSTRVEHCIARGLVWRDAEIRFPVHEFITRLAPLPLALAGDARIALDTLVLGAGAVTAISGRIVWNEAAVRGTPPLALGTFIATPALQNDGTLRFELADQGGPLNVTGRFDLKKERQWELDLALRPTTGASDALRELLTMAGPPDALGETRIRRQGGLAPPTPAR